VICSFTKPNLSCEHSKISSRDHDLVTSDLQMPSLNGFEFIRKVKEVNSNVKVFLITCFEINEKRIGNGITI